MKTLHSIQILYFDDILKIVIECDQEIPQSQTADNPVAPRGRAAQPSRDTPKTIKQSNQLSLPHQDDCNTRMDISLSFRVNFFGHRIFNALSMSLKKLLDENHKLHNFYE